MANEIQIYEEEYWHGFRLFYGRKDSAQRLEQSIDTLKKDKQKITLEQEHVLSNIYRQEQQRRASGKVYLPAGTFQQVADQFHLSLSGAKKLYSRYRNRGVVRDTRGKPAECWLTIAQQKELIGLYLFNDYFIYLADGSSQKVSHRQAMATPALITSAMRQTHRDLAAAEWFTPEYVLRYLKRQEVDNPTPFQTARENPKHIRNFLLPLFSSDTTFPFERVQSDARFLPIYISHHGNVCTAILLIFVDEFSGYIPSWRILPRQEVNGIGASHTIDFKTQDVLLILAELMRNTGLRPKLIYTDNAAQYKSMVKSLPYLALDDEMPMMVVYTEPGSPQGRGMVENTLKRIGAKLVTFAGYVDNEKDLISWRNARTQPNLLTLERVRKELTKIIDVLNTTPRKDTGQSPADIWQYTAGPRYKAPPKNRFVHLLLNAQETNQSVSNKGVQYNRGTRHAAPVFYIPKDMSVATDERWLRAAARGQHVPFQVHPMEEFGTFYYARLDGDYWDEMIPARQHGRTVTARMDNRDTLKQSMKNTIQAIREETVAAQQEKHGQMPQFDPISNEAVYEPPKRFSSKTKPPKPISRVEDIPTVELIEYTSNVSEDDPYGLTPSSDEEAQAVADMIEQIRQKAQGGAK